MCKVVIILLDKNLIKPQAFWNTTFKRWPSISNSWNWFPYLRTVIFYSKNDRIIKVREGLQDLQVTKPTLRLNTTIPTKPVYPVHSFFEHFQGWPLHRLPGKPVPMLNHSLVKRYFQVSNMNSSGATWLRLPFGQLWRGRSPPSSSPPGWTSPALSGVPHKTFSVDLSQALLPFVRHTPALRCPSWSEWPRAGHSGTQGDLFHGFPQHWGVTGLQCPVHFQPSDTWVPHWLTSPLNQDCFISEQISSSHLVLFELTNYTLKNLL